MFHRRLERQKAGQPIVARTLNQIMDLVERIANLRVAAPLAMTDTASGPQIYLAASLGGKLYPGITAGSGTWHNGSPTAPAASPVGVTIYTSETSSGWNSAIQVTAWSIYTGTIPNSKSAWYWKSPDTGAYYIVTADC